MERSSWRAWVAAGLTMAALPNIVRAEPEPRLLPERFYVAESVQPLAEAMWLRSPGFRAQLQRIADAGVRVVVQVVSPAELSPAAANATMVREHGALKFVRLRLSAATDWAPLLAHELEHVLEALEGVDLRAEARRGGHVWRVGHHGYETARAREAGYRIAREYRNGGPTRIARSAAGDAGQEP